ncbi:MAG: DNA repair protein RadC [Lachnospiraceae bacterium]|nr:DNA repair protein RadC [Lachnospiraceae bacterium]
MKKEKNAYSEASSSELVSQASGSVKDLPSDERPYEKCFKLGAQSLTDTELIAVILKNGAGGSSSLELARNILSMADGTTSILALKHKSVASLMKIRGIGKVKAVTLKCVSEISERVSRASYARGVDFKHPSEIANYYSEEMRHLEHEQTRLICLNGSNRLIGDAVLTTGLVNQALLSTRDIFIKAIDFQAVYIVLLHNHPGGNPAPSRNDVEMTKKIASAGEMMDIKLIDHIIIGDSSYVSMRESGYLQ